MESKNHYTTVLGIRLYYEIINQQFLNDGRPLLVFLHEGLGSCRQWKDFPLSVSEKTGCPALLYDRYGYGRSESLKELRTGNYMHDEALKFLPELFSSLKLQHYDKILIGHSDGGSIAIIHAGSFPGKIKGIITEAAHLFIEEISVTGIRAVTEEYKAGGLKKALNRYHGKSTDTMFHGWADTWLKKKMWTWNIEQYLATIKVPFLAIQGNQDQYGTFAQLQSIKKHVKNKVKLFFVQDCGHVPHQQARELVLDKMATFILKDVIK